MDRTPGRGSGWLTLAAGLSFAIAALHLAMIVIGAPAYSFFTAPQRMISLAHSGSIQPALITAAVALVFTLFGFYALAGAGRAPALPVQRLALVGISGVHILRGLLIVPEALLLTHADGVPARALVFSAISLVVGLIYAVGTVLCWSRMPVSAVERSPV